MTRIEQMLGWLEVQRDRDVIKIVTGVRGCGKSELLSKYAERLRESGVPGNQIIHIDFEHPATRNLHTPEDLIDFVDAHAPKNPSGQTHLLLDEICELQEFDVALGTLFAIKQYNLVVTCSNRRPISDRFREYLSGCYAHAVMLPPSFRELPATTGATFEQRLEDCLKFGNLPYTFHLRHSPKGVLVYLSGLWNTILVKDILTRNRMTDSRFTERLLERIYDKLGESESLRKISADATIEGHVAAPNTVLSYIDALDESMLMRRVCKYDVFLDETSKSGYRFYLADIALGRTRYGDFRGDPSNAIRNLVYLELVGRGNAVYCGRYDNEEFDFVTLEKEGPHCWQFAPKTVNGRVPAAVLGPFKRMPRDIDKTVITRGPLPAKAVPGIKFITLEKFLTERINAHAR